MSRSYPALERYYPEDPESRGVHACNGPHIPCKSRNVNQTLGKSECMSIQKSLDAIYRPYEWHILRKKTSDRSKLSVETTRWRGLLLFLYLFSRLVPATLPL